MFFLLILPVFVLQVESGTSTNTLYAHAETTTIGSVSYYLHKLSSADGPATTLSKSAASTGRKLMGRWVYPLSGVVAIPASTWTVTYRAMKSSSATSVVAHGDIDILIRKSDNTIRTTTATNVANSPSLTLVNVWQTLTGTYDWLGYTVVDQTDYLEVAYYIEVTTAQTSKYVRLLVDDATLPLADQTKIENVIFAYPNEAPVASFTYSPAEPFAEEAVTFDASASYDPDGSIVSYQWDFGDGNVTTVADPIITHVYGDCGNCTVTLTVTDNEGLASSTSQIVPVINPCLLRLWADVGSYVGSHPDAWILESWIVSSDVSAGGSVSFNLYIDAKSNACGAYATYDVYLAVAVNDTAQVASITIGSTTITTFTYGNVTWPSVAGGGTLSPHGVYPTSYALAPFGDVASNHGYYTTPGNPYGPYYAYRTYIPVTITASSTMNAGFKVHFDAQGVLVRGSTKPGHRNTNPFSHDLTSTGTYTPPVTADVVFDPVGVGVDFGGAVLTVDGVGYDVTVLPKTFTWVVGSEHTFEYHSPLVVDAGKQYVWTQTTGLSTAQSGTIMVPSGGGSVTGHYKIQYLVTFSQTGLSAEASGTVVTVDGVPKTLADLPYSLWVDENSVVTFSYEAIVSSIISGQQFRLDSVTGPMSPISVTASTTVTGNYVVQYSITFDQTGLDNTAVGTIVTVDSLELQFADLPYGIWVDKNSIVTYSYSSTVPSTSTGKQFRLVDVTGPVSPITITDTVTVTGNYKAQFEITFNQSGVGLDFAGTVVTIDGVEYTVSMLPVSFWWNEDSIHTFSFSSPLIVDAGKRYVWVSTSGLSTLQSGTLTITGSGSVTGNYVVQVKYQITFSQTGVGSDFTGTIVVIDGVDYKFTDLPVSFMWDAGSIHTFSFQSPLVVAVNAKQYVWTSTTGLSTQQSGSITVSTSGSVTGNYKTQYYLTVSSPYGSPVPTTGWFDAGTVTASVTSPWLGPAGTRYVCTGWTGTGSVPPSGTETSVTFTISEPSSITWNWKTQHLLTVLTDPAGLSPQPTRNPTGEAGPANGWWYDATTPVTLTAQTVPEYTFNYWDVDGASQGSGVNPIPVDMDAPHTATAHYSPAPPSVSISPPSASIRVGQSVAFNSTASGGKPPYRYQWYLNGTPVSGATSSSWTFTPATTGTYLIYLTVTDQNDNTAQSATSTVKVGPAPPVGGYTISFAKNVPTSQTAAYTALIAFFGLVLIVIRRKRK